MVRHETGGREADRASVFEHIRRSRHRCSVVDGLTESLAAVAVTRVGRHTLPCSTAHPGATRDLSADGPGVLPSRDPYGRRPGAGRSPSRTDYDCSEPLVNARWARSSARAAARPCRAGGEARNRNAYRGEVAIAKF